MRFLQRQSKEMREELPREHEAEQAREHPVPGSEEAKEQEPEQALKLATERLAAADDEIARLKAEYLALPERIRLAEWHFQEALRAFNIAKDARANCSGD